MMSRRAAILAAIAAGAAQSSFAQRPSSSAQDLASKAGLGAPKPTQIAMLLYPGFTALDFVGPYHFLASMPGAKTHLVTNQRSLAPVASDIGLAISPTSTIEDCPRDLTVLFTPGGTAGTLAAARDARTIAFIQDRGSRAQFITSVCTGSVVLGVAGLLKGRRATSHWCAVPALQRFGATPVRERIVRDGNVITGAGVSAGLDFGSALVAEILGHPWAEAAVLMAEYHPQPPIAGGSIETARPEIKDLLSASLADFSRQVNELTPV
jgi:putative intracellular protease/amidase